MYSVSIRLQLNFRVGGKSKRKTLQIEMQSNKPVQKGKTTEWLWQWIMYAKDGRTLDPVAVAFLRGHVIALGRSHAFICIFTAGTDAAAFTLHLLCIYLLHLHWLRDCRLAASTYTRRNAGSFGRAQNANCFASAVVNSTRSGLCMYIDTGLPLRQQSIWLNGMLGNKFNRV